MRFGGHKICKSHTHIHRIWAEKSVLWLLYITGIFLMLAIIHVIWRQLVKSSLSTSRRDINHVCIVYTCIIIKFRWKVDIICPLLHCVTNARWMRNALRTQTQSYLNLISMRCLCTARKQQSSLSDLRTLLSYIHIIWCHQLMIKNFFFNTQDKIIYICKKKN